MNFIDLFCGAGGLSIGLENAGLNCLLGIDNNKHAIETFKQNHPNSSALLEDIHNVSTDNIYKLISTKNIDLICGGPPCQGFSTLGTNNSNDPRNFLFKEFFRIVKDILPNYVLLENVLGILSKRNNFILNSILEIFSTLGYIVDVKVLESSNFGVPQIRNRVIFLANRLNKTNIYPEVFARSYRRSVEWAFDNLISDINHNVDENTAIKDRLTASRIAYIPCGAGIRYEKDQIEYLPKSLWFDVDWSSLPEKRFRETKLRRLPLYEPSPTINTSRYTYFHPYENRHLTVREAAAIQSFPSTYKFCGTIPQQWKQVGNSVPPLLATAIGKTLLNE